MTHPEPRRPGPRGSRDFYESYWSALDAVLQERTTVPRRELKYIRSYYAIYPLQSRGTHIAAVIEPPDCDTPMRVEFSLVRKELGAAFERWVAMIRSRAEQINDSLGPGLDWASTTSNQFQVGKNFSGWDLAERSHWPQQHNLLAIELQRFFDVFSATCPG